ncbi:MAG: autotransporter domain-containing protein [Solidesulfovibrio sp.]
MQWERLALKPGRGTFHGAIFVLLAACWLVVPWSTPVFAVETTVTTTTLGTAGSLNSAVTASTGATNTIYFDIAGASGGTITLASALAPTYSVSLRNDADTTGVTITGASTLFNLPSGATLDLGGVYALTLAATGGGAQKGISSAGVLSIGTLASTASVTVTNATTSVSGLYASGALTMTNLAGTVSGDGGNLTYGLYADGAITITNLTGSVTASATAGVGAYGLKANNGITITNLAGTVAASSGGNGAYGLDASNGITITNLTGTVTASASTGNFVYGLKTNTDIRITNLAGTVTAAADRANTAYALYSSGGTITLGSIASTGNLTATAKMSAAYGLFASGNIAITGAQAGAVSATVTNGSGAYGLFAAGTINGGTAGTPLAISGTVTAQAAGTAVAVTSGGAMNLAVTGTLSGVDTTGGGSGYAIQSGAAADAVTLGTGATLVGKVDLGGGTDTLTLVGTGAASNQFINIENLVVGTGSTTNWTLNPTVANASSFTTLAINANANLTINENVAIASSTVTDNGSLTFNLNSGVTTRNWAISGTGRVVKTGAGTLALTGDNTYSGGTVFAEGTVSVASYANLGTGSCTFAGGTLLVAGADVLQTTLAVPSSGVVFDTTAESQTIGATLTGTGNVTKTGGNLLTLTGNSAAYTGTTTISAGKVQIAAGATLGGTVIVGSGGTLGGYGTVGSVTNSGTLTPGGSIGTLTVAGNYVQGASGVLQAEVSLTTSDLLIVNGTANLGGTLLVVPQQAYYAPGTSWTILTAAGGVSGTFASVASSSWNLRFTPTYTTNGVSIAIGRLSYILAGQSAKAASVGAGLDGAIYNATGEMATLLGVLDTSPSEVTNYAMSVLSPEVYDAYTQAFLDGSRALTAVQRSGLVGEADAGSAAFASAQDVGPASIAALAGPNATPLGASAAPGGAAMPVGRFGVFLRPLGLHASQQGSANQSGYETLTGGLTGGILYRPSAELTLGLAPAFMTQSLTLKSAGGGQGTIQDWSLALLGAYRHDAWHVDAVARAGLNTFDSSRNLPLPGVARTAKGHWNGWNTSLSVGGGYDFTAGDVTFGPIASLEWQHVSQDAFGETRAGTVGQRLQGRNNDAVTSVVGARVFRSFETTHGVITPELRAAWGAQWLGESQGITASFIGAPLSEYRAKTADHAYHAAILDAGVTMRMGKALSASARAGVELFRPGHESQAVSLGLLYSF